MHAAARQSDLARMVAQVHGAFDEDDAVRRFAEDSDDHRSPATFAHASDNSERAALEQPPKGFA